MILVGDVGATHTRLGWAEPCGKTFSIHDVEVFESSTFPGLGPILDQFLKGREGRAKAAGFGLPGPVDDFRVKTTNIPWEVDGRQLEGQLGCKVALCNDLAAAAHGVILMVAAPQAGDRLTLQEGKPTRGNLGVIAAGTGLGESLAVVHGEGYAVCSSEGSHTEFGPRDEEEVELWRFFRARYGRVSYERLASGMGLVEVFEFYAGLQKTPEKPWKEGEDPAAAIARAGMERRCEVSARALHRFTSVYGAEAGNLALKGLTLGGVWLAGGIAPKIAPFLLEGPFLEAFRDKGRYRPLMERIPVNIALDFNLALRGAAAVTK